MDKKIFSIFKNRVVKLAGNNFADIYPESMYLDAEYAVSKKPVPFKDRLELHYRPAGEGDVWGESWDSAWFHLTGTVPESFAGREICLRLNIGSELLLFDADGVPLYGLTGYSVFNTSFFKDCYVLKNAKPGTGSRSGAKELRIIFSGSTCRVRKRKIRLCRWGITPR